MKLAYFSVVAFTLASVSPAGAATFTALNDLPGGEFNSLAYGISADGSVVVGFSESANGYEAFRWTRHGGMINVKEPTLRPSRSLA